jgi:D-glycero-D-manno-heptose 1,7-bisphosphate phosphatase
MSEVELLILDRDGVINHDSDNYIRKPDEFILIESSLQAIASCNRANIPVVVATNQSGVGRGYYSLDILAAIHEKMHAALKEHGAWVDKIYFCPHKPDAGCDCRKPSTGMLQSIRRDYPEQFAKAIMVGDSWSDWQVAEASGVPPYLVKTGKGERTLKAHGEEIPQERVFSDLSAIVSDVVFGFVAGV